MDKKDKTFLLLAHKLAKDKFGYTFPNPSVGCLIVKNNKIISIGATASEGRPHAEEVALKKAGKDSIGSTMYVTLEPCNHKSLNGSCTDQIIKSGIKSIYIAESDPDPRTHNKSIKKLKKNKIKVYIGMTREKTISLNKFFFKSFKNKRPYIKIKMAISNDKKIAWEDYSSKWISNAKSREFAHQIRKNSQAILTSVKTIIKDNPNFTARKKNKIIKYLPIIIIDSSLKIPINSKILKNISKKRIIIFTSKNNKKSKYLKKIGCKIIFMKKNNKSQMNLKNLFNKIYKLEIRDILIEAGVILFTQLINNNLFDEIHIFKAPFNIGNQGIPMINGKFINKSKLFHIYKKKFGNDEYSNYVIKT